VGERPGATVGLGLPECRSGSSDLLPGPSVVGRIET